MVDFRIAVDQVLVFRVKPQDVLHQPLSLEPLALDKLEGVELIGSFVLKVTRTSVAFHKNK